MTYVKMAILTIASKVVAPLDELHHLLRRRTKRVRAGMAKPQPQIDHLPQAPAGIAPWLVDNDYPRTAQRRHTRGTPFDYRAPMR